MREPKLASKIAKQLQRFHHVEIPGSKEPQLWNDVWKFFEKGPLSFLPAWSLSASISFDWVTFVNFFEVNLICVYFEFYMPLFLAKVLNYPLAFSVSPLYLILSLKVTYYTGMICYALCRIWSCFGPIDLILNIQCNLFGVCFLLHKSFLRFSFYIPSLMWDVQLQHIKTIIQLD